MTGNRYALPVIATIALIVKEFVDTRNQPVTKGCCRSSRIRPWRRYAARTRERRLEADTAIRPMPRRSAVLGSGMATRSIVKDRPQPSCLAM